jgi:hypothetical protein
MAHRKTMTKQEKERNQRLLREYQVSLEERTKVFKFQGEKCAICHKFERDMKISLSMDHDHKSGLLRGLLCLRCNKALEILYCDPEIAKRAFEYLTNPPFVVLLGTRYTAPGRVGTKVRRKRLALMRENEKGRKEKERNHKSSKKQKSV